LSEKHIKINDKEIRERVVPRSITVLRAISTRLGCKLKQLIAH